ncbi:MAG: hypothetical protein ABEH81_04345 [Halopenitus sp.]
MSVRTALKQARWITLGVMLAVVWTLVVVAEVASSFAWANWAVQDFVGQSAMSGIVGLAVMAILLGLLVVLYGELSETEPNPTPWPPE